MNTQTQLCSPLLHALTEDIVSSMNISYSVSELKSKRYPKNNKHTLHLALLGVFMMSGQLALAQSTSTVAVENTHKFVAAVANTTIQSRPVAVLDGMYAANAKVGRIHVKVDNSDIPADGRSELTVHITVYDLQDNLMTEPVLATLEHTGGKIQLLGTANDEFGNTAKDADRLVPGVQLKVLNGKASFSLIAPNTAQDVALTITAGNVYASGVIPFALDLRDMIAAGLIEGALRLNKNQSATTLSPVRIDDGFEQEIRRFSRSNTHSNGQINTIAARGAFFLKGKISGDSLLSMSYDSDKETRARLLRDIRPQEMYPVYGDASTKGFEARSSDRLYVRIDNNRSFALYGDYNTADGFSQSAGTGLVAGNNLRQLATYNRSLTGIKGHAENGTGFVNTFVAYDTLKNVTEELRANGTSGPFAVKNTTALENSEKIEVLVRDRNNLSTILSVTPLERLNDYVFEPFSSRILLSRAIPSLDSNGNPMSLRISYEVDQGGEKFLVAGVDGQANVGDKVTLGGSYIQDKNPIAPVKIAGIHAGIQLGEHTTVIAEIAQSRTGITTTLTSLPAVAPATPLTEYTGKAARIELAYTGDTLQASGYIKRTEANFMNVSAGTTGADTQQMGAKLNLKINSTLSVHGDIQRTKDLNTDANTLGGRIGVQAIVNKAVSVHAGIRSNTEQGQISGTLSGIGCNPAPGSAFAPASGGGFSGADSATLLNVNGVNCAAPTNNVAINTETKSNALYVGGIVKVTDKLSVNATAELGKTTSTALTNSDSSARRLELGAAYQIAERTRLYARADTQRGLSSQYGLDGIINKSSSVSLGIDTSYMKGGNIFSEYRLRDAASGREAQLATGLRNAWHVSEGVLISTGLERLRLLSGNGQNATAVTFGLDYTRSEMWKAGSRLEWRRLDSNAYNTNVGTLNQQDTLLFNTNLARKLTNNWTLLGRNYYLATNNHGEKANGWQDRLQVGFAYRPVKHNRFDALSKLEYKTESNVNAQNEYRKVWVGALHTNYHPSRPWWLSARAAGKFVEEQYPTNEGGGMDRYKAYLLSGRMIYDITEKIDLGLNVSFMSGKALGQIGSSVQKGLGIEAGYAMTSNLLTSIGYNFAGYTDKDLTSDYTSRGMYMRLRYKFDQDLFESYNPKVNNTLER